MQTAYMHEQNSPKQKQKLFLVQIGTLKSKEAILIIN